MLGYVDDFSHETNFSGYVIFHFTDSRATFTSSFAGSESVFASRETGVSSMPTEASQIDESVILQVYLVLTYFTWCTGMCFIKGPIFHSVFHLKIL